MMQQTTLFDVLLQQKSRTTRRETFLNAMDQVVPWAELMEIIQPVYPASGRGRPPIGIERMLRLYFIQQWYGFSDVGTSAHVSDVVMTSELLHGQEKRVIADAGYIGVEKRAENSGKSLEWMIAMKRGKLKAMPEGQWKETVRQIERKKAQIPSRVEHPFHVIKNLFHYRKTRYRGLKRTRINYRFCSGFVICTGAKSG